MLLVKTYLDKSPIHGIGVFAGETIRKDAEDLALRLRLRPLLHAQAVRQAAEGRAKDFIKLHGYQWGNEILLSMDYDTFMNHSDNPNTYFHNGYVLARSTSAKGTEITNDYRAFEAAFCAAFLKAKKK